MVNTILMDYFRTLSTKDKKKFEKFTYHCTTETISNKRLRGFEVFIKTHNIKSFASIEDFINAK